MTRIFGSPQPPRRRRRRARPDRDRHASPRRCSPRRSSTSASATAPAGSTLLRRWAACAERHLRHARLGGAAGRRSPPSRCSPPCSACTGTSPCTSTTAATPGRWPTPPTTSSSPGSSASSPPASSRWCCRASGPSAVAIRLGRDWWAPLGGVLICACGAFSLIGFPLDDVWHRLFGQDVTLWGPTHLMLIGGAAMTLVGIAVLTVEGLRANAALEPRRRAPARRGMRAVALTGGLMVGLSTFQAEFDFGVPQFRLVFQPMLMMLAAGLGLVLARIYGGRGAALGAVAFFIVMRGGAGAAGRPAAGGDDCPTSRSTSSRRWWSRRSPCGCRPSGRCASGSGRGSASAPSASPPSGPGRSLDAAALALGAVPRRGAARLRRGARRGDDRRLDRRSHLAVEPAERPPALRGGRGLRAAVLAALVGFGLYTRPSRGVSARVALHEVGGGPAAARCRRRSPCSPPDAAEDAEWFDVTAWQGGGLVVDRLRADRPRSLPDHGADPGLTATGRR